MLYKDWIKTWLENYVKPTSKIRTYERYSLLAENHIVSVIGDYDLNTLSPILLQELITKLLQNGNKINGRPLSASTVNTIISVIQSSLKMANLLGYLQNNISIKIKRPKIEEKEVSCFSLSEQKQIEQAILNSKKKKLLGIIVCLYSGLRIGELLSLKWQDIDFQKGLLSVNTTCYDAKGGIRLESKPKTKTSKRVIPLPRQIITIIKELKKSSLSIYMLTDKNKPISVRSYQRSFELLLKKLNIKHKGFHAIRHTFATRAMECGMDVKTLAEILGHKNPIITLNRYAHSLIEHKQNMMNKIGKLL